MASHQRSRGKHLDPPEGWAVEVHMGWPALDPDFRGTPVLLPVKRSWLPERFCVQLRPAREEWRLWLNFNVVDGEVRMPVANAAPVDVAEALDQLRRAWPIKSLKRYVIVELVNRIVQTELLDEIERERPPGADPDEHLYIGLQTKGRRLGLAVAAVEEIPLAPRRNRVTRELIEEVAAIYREADSLGHAPTKAVERVKRVSPATASRWVAMAREAEGIDMPPIRRGQRKQQQANQGDR